MKKWWYGFDALSQYTIVGATLCIVLILVITFLAPKDEAVRIRISSNSTAPCDCMEICAGHHNCGLPECERRTEHGQDKSE